MDNKSKTTFGEWIADQLAERDMRPADLARGAGLDPAVVSNLMNSKRNPGIDSCKKIAKAFKMPVGEVFRAAGIMPPEPSTDPLIENVTTLMLEMSPENKREILEYVKLRYKLADDNKRNRKASPRGHATT